MKYSFVFGDAKARQFAWQRLEDDARITRLSPAFKVYYRLRPIIPLVVRQLLQRTRPVEVAADWYLPIAFLQGLAQCLDSDSSGLQIIAPWPENKTYSVVLTHDVETAAGMRNIEAVASIEEELGFRSSWNLVPYKYPIDLGLVRDLTSRGFEIGVHGYNHDGKLFLSKRVFQKRARRINAAIRDLGAVGFRAPMVHRNLQWLQQLDIEYDASYFDIDPFQAMPGGIGGIWPFVAGKFVELPYTLPQDHTLFIVLQARDTSIWERKRDFLIKHRGMALMLTHPDYLTPPRLALYRELLQRIRDGRDYWHALPRDVARWWQDRERSTIEASQAGDIQVRGPARDRASIANIFVEENDFTIGTVQPA